MSRLRTIGFEVGGFNSEQLDAAYFEGNAGGTVITEATVVFSGIQSAEYNGGAGAASFNRIRLEADEVALTRIYFARVKLQFAALPAGTVQVLRWANSGTTFMCSLRLTSAGKVQLFNDVAATQVGSDSAATVAVNTWYTFELSCKISSGSADDDIEGRLDGTSIAASTGLTLGTAVLHIVDCGWIVSPGSGSKQAYADDLIVNDNQGAANNTWPGVDEKIVYCKPISDSQVGSWTGGAAGTTNLWEAVNNIPPIGTATETDLTQIENNVNGGGTNYIATLQSYTTAGVPAGATIKAVQVLCAHGEDIATGAKTGQVKVASNPAGAFKTFTFGDDIGALNTWPQTWRGRWTAGEDNPSVTLGTSPTIELDKTDTSTRVASVCALGLYVGYTEAGGVTVSPGAVTHTYTPQAPQVRARVQPGAVVHTYTGQVPTLVGTIRPAQVTHTYTSQVPQVRASVQPGAATHSYAGQAPAVTVSIRVLPDAASHTYTAQAPQARASVGAPVATHSYTGQIPVITAGVSVDVPVVTHTYTARTPQAQMRVQPGPATHIYSGITPDIDTGAGAVATAEWITHARRRGRR